MGPRLLASLSVAGVALIIYFNSISGEFVFDDHEAIDNNLDVRTDTPLSTVFLNDFWGQPLSDPESHKSYRPLTILSFRLNRLLHGMWTPGFHSVNIATHATVCVLFLWLCLVLRFSLGASVAAALLFTVHPVHTEAVSNIVGRTEPLSAIFFLLSLLAYHSSLNTTSKRPETFSKFWLVLSITLAVISLLCKEQGLTALGVCLAYDVTVVCGFHIHWVGKACKYVIQLCRGELSAKQRKLPKWLTSLLCRSLILVTSAVAVLFLRIVVIGGGGHPLFIESDNPASFSPYLLTRLLTYSYLYAFDFWLLLCPSRLCFDWSMGSVPLVESLHDQRNLATCGMVALFGILILFGVGGLTVKDWTASEERGSHGRRRRQLTLFATALMVVPFLPASNLLFPVGFVVAERVLYIPSMGFCLLVATGLTYCSRRHSVPLSVLVFILFAFSAKTLVRNSEWKSTQTLAESALKVNPSNAKVLMTMGNVLTQKGNRTCELYYREAIRLRPQYTAAWTNLGLVLLNTDRPQEAERCYKEALSIKPNHINANTNMGHLCRIQQRWEEARDHYTVAVERRPSNPLLHYYIGFVSEKIGSSADMQKAEASFNRALQLHPSYWEAHLALARLLATTSNGRKLQYGYSVGKQGEKALFHYQRAVQLKHDDTSAHYEFGKLLLTKGKITEAERELRATIQLSPSHVLAHLDLGIAYEQLGNRGSAVAELETALKLDESLNVARQKLHNLKTMSL